jgi:beta-lactam-binding protein with PASTA domain
VEDRGASLTGALLEQRYRVDTLLARGGMSSVYRGLDTRLDRPVAIKVMDPRFAADQTFVNRFEREARSAAKIHHPNVVAVHDQGLDGDHVYLVMELVDGGTLRDLLAERGALGVPLALSVMEPVLGALAAAHRAGLVHRDVKPENVLIGTNGAVKVGDFGLVRAIASVGTTSSSVILGTVAYLSPEQVTTGTATARGDVYSAGILLYEMLTGGPPYTGDNAISIAYRHVNDDVPAPSAAHQAGVVPPALDELVLRATRRDPAARPLDAGAFLLELERIRATTAMPRVPIPVPRYHLVDRTLPVTAEDQIRALGLDVPGDIGSTSGELAEGKAGGAAVAPVAPVAPVGSATVVSRAPAGFQAVGPRGTKAWLRTDLEPPPVPGMGNPPSMPMPVLTAAAPPYGPQSAPHGMPSHPPTGGHPMQGPPPAPPNRNRRTVLLSLLGVLLVAVLSTVTWWFAAGRWTEVPEVVGLDAASAESRLTESDLAMELVEVRHNSIRAGLVIRTEPDGGNRALRGDSIRLVVSKGRPKVPNVEPGITFEQAEQALLAEQLQPQRDDGAAEFSDTVPKDQVVRLEPRAGTELDLNAPVKIILSKGAAPRAVPDVRGRTAEEARQALRAAGFNPVDGTPEFAGDVDGNRVIRTNPPANSKPGNGSRVSIIVSNAITVPNLGGRTVAEAKTVLTGLGLQVEAQHVMPETQSRVVGQLPPAGSRVPAGTKVTIFGIP